MSDLGDGLSSRGKELKNGNLKRVIQNAEYMKLGIRVERISKLFGKLETTIIILDELDDIVEEEKDE